jgi:predicted aspartyl protease
MVQTSVAWDLGIQSPYFLLYTGFTGDLVVPPELAKDLGLNLDGVTPMRTASNEIVYVQTGTALG